MNIKQRRLVMLLVISMMMTLSGAVSLLRADNGTCNGANVTLPFADVASSGFFCQIAEAYFAGLTSGTSATTFGPGNNVTREQMAAFITRTLDQSLRRGSRRAALKQFWTTQGPFDAPLTSVGNGASGVACDGTDLWVANYSSGTVSRVRASDGKLLETWTGADGAIRVLVARGRIYVTGGSNSPAKLYRIDPTQPAGPVTTLNVDLGPSVDDIAFDGDRIWISSFIGGGVYLLSFGLLCSPCVTHVTTGLTATLGLVYDGSNMWVTNPSDGALKKLDANGNVILSVPVGVFPKYAVFDGTNIWALNNIGNSDGSIAVVRASTGAVIATLTGNGLKGPLDAAFDGERILVTNEGPGNGDTVSLWKASDLSPLGSVQVGLNQGGVNGVCSDGLNFWITLRLTGKLARF